MDQLSEGIVGVSELLGDLPLGTVVDEDGAEGFVAALQGPRGMGEKVAAAGVVHRSASDVSVFLAGIGLTGEFTREPVSGSSNGVTAEVVRVGHGKTPRDPR